MFIILLAPQKGAEDAKNKIGSRADANRETDDVDVADQRSDEKRFILENDSGPDVDEDNTARVDCNNDGQR